MAFSKIKKKNKIMITSDMLLLKAVVLVDLVEQIFQIFLKIFLVISVVVDEVLEDGTLTIEDLI